MDKDQFINAVLQKSVNDCLKKAYMYDGKVFGRHVRDVLVPLQKDPEARVKFGDIDLWFTKVEPSEEFVASMGSEFVLVHDHYEVHQYGFHLFNVSIVISDVYPLSDFDINMLSFQYNGTDWCTRSYTDKSPDQLIEAIHNKQAVIDAKYINRLVADPIEFEKVYNTYIKNGWSITFNGDPMPDSFELMTKLNNQELTTILSSDLSDLSDFFNESLKYICTNFFSGP